MWHHLLWLTHKGLGLHHHDDISSHITISPYSQIPGTIRLGHDPHLNRGLSYNTDSHYAGIAVDSLFYMVQSTECSECLHLQWKTPSCANVPLIPEMEHINDIVAVRSEKIEGD